MKARIAESGPPPLGLHILMGPDAPVKVANMIENIQQGHAGRDHRAPGLRRHPRHPRLGP
jgi:hypothetical protein